MTFFLFRKEKTPAKKENGKTERNGKEWKETERKVVRWLRFDNGKTSP